MSDNVNWQIFQAETTYFIRVENSTLFFYEIDFDDSSVEYVIKIITNGHILQFKILSLNTGESSNKHHIINLMVVLLVEFQHSYYLYWYKVFGTTYILYSTLPLQRQIQDMEFVREGNQYELLLLDNDVYLKGQSLIDIYGFNIDYDNHRVNIW